HLFRAWFTAGFLNLVPINWDETPAAQLEKLMDYEVVHPMTDWDDLRRRLARDRLCYAFYHPNMPGEPLIFVEIALTHTIASSIDDLFDPSKIVRDISEATTAIFYSINATQPGLGGVSLGDSLIKTVVTELQRTLPQLKRFSTLSPIPGFRDRYLEPILRGDEKAAKFELEREEIPGFFDEAGLAALRQARPGEGAVDALAAVLADDAWAEDESLRLAIKAGLLRLCHFYLTREKRGSRPANPVANFHLSNGALIYNLNYLSNTRPKGMAESYGMTVNYRYDLPRIEANQEALRQGECVVSPQLEKMLRLGISA
ncbi:MAG: malonyl-CoA decarboxylase domain-containing protein, partial [Phycisphaeraceae bacterium]